MYDKIFDITKVIAVVDIMIFCNIAPLSGLSTEENHISIQTACSTTLHKTVNQKTALIGSRPVCGN